ncbi:SirB1 family protein [soil metagenome]
MTERFARLLSLPEPEVRLDEASLLLAAHAYPGLDVSAELQRLDALADRCYAPTLDALVQHLFVDEGFAGNKSEYFDPRNSFLNDVVERRLGIPITLGVLAMEVGRRIGVPLWGVSMPGRFLLRDKVDQDLFLDPFARGAPLDSAGCEAAFRAMHGAETQFDPTFLEPAGAYSILARMLANLKAIFLARRDRAGLAWVLRLRVEVPGIPIDERRELASALASRGRFGDAALQLEHLADLTPAAAGDKHRWAATRLRARLN